MITDRSVTGSSTTITTVTVPLIEVCFWLELLSARKWKLGDGNNIHWRDLASHLWYEYLCMYKCLVINRILISVIIETSPYEIRVIIIFKHSQNTSGSKIIIKIRQIRKVLRIKWKWKCVDLLRIINYADEFHHFSVL